MIKAALIGCIALLLTSVADAGSVRRSHAAIAAFKRANPCPANGHTRGACPGYVVDHIKPLCAGGADHHSNMQWQTVDAAKAKDRLERVQCRK